MGKNENGHVIFPHSAFWGSFLNSCLFFYYFLVWCCFVSVSSPPPPSLILFCFSVRPTKLGKGRYRADPLTGEASYKKVKTKELGPALQLGIRVMVSVSLEVVFVLFLIGLS
jgi:hypothetical protein